VYSKVRESVRIRLLELFCRHLLGVETLPEIVRRPRFRLNHLVRRETALHARPVDGVTGVRIRRLRVSVPRTGEWLTLEVTPEGAWHDIYTMLDRHLPTTEFLRDEVTVSLAGLTVGYLGEGKSKTLTFELTRRGTTNLASRSEFLQDLGERVLEAWGILDE
jgi:hypothetical protein